jgi:F0F1-type ATP synthase assembly protein I
LSADQDKDGGLSCDNLSCLFDNEAGCMTAENGRLISRSLRIQSITSMLLAGGLLLVGPVAAYSSMFGSLAAFIPTLVFAMIVAPKIGPDSNAFLRMAVIGEVAKLLLTGLLCVVVFVWIKPLAAGWFFAGMATVIFSGRMALLSKP